MTERTSFYRKIGYGIAIVALCFLLGWVSAPATTTREGGKLAQLRKQYGLSQSEIGDIDPASETIKLATLGLRGVAVNLLWEKANYYKKDEDWTNLTATLEQLAKLQPNFITFWKFQAWNLTYNVSVEFDDFKDRYFYVRRGIEFLKEGEKYNVDNPILLWDLGWFVGQKIGRADEYVQYRKLFKEDDDFHPPDRTQEQRDNWLVGKEHYLDAIDSVDNKGFSLGRKSPRDFYSSPAKSQMNYAEAIEEEGFFPLARRAWIRAAEEWRQFGNTLIEHSTGVKLRLGSQKRLEDEVADMRAKLEAMRPGTRDQLVQQKRQALTEEERQILDTPAEKLTPQQSEKLASLQERTTVTDREVAERIGREQPADEKQALQLVNELDRTSQELQFTINYKRDANYDYWQNRADFEQTDDALAAREFMFRAREAFKEANLPEAKKLYQQGFAKWRQVIDRFPFIMEDDQTTGDDILEFVKKYREVLDQLDERLGDDFPLWDVIEKFDREQEFTEEKAERRERQGLPPEGTTPSEDGATQPQQAEPSSEAATPETQGTQTQQATEAQPQEAPAQPAEGSARDSEQ
jgi:hypothetical protein